MAWLKLDDNQKIMKVIDRAISDQIEIKVQLKGEETAFTSKIIEINHGSISSEIERRPELIIEELVPEQGNSLMKSLPEVSVEFSINHNLCRCTVECIGPSSAPPHAGFIMSFPESLEIAERRREERSTYGTTEFISAGFRLGAKAETHRFYHLNVLTCSRHGLGLVVAREDLDLLRILKKGDRLNNIALLSSWAMLTVNGTVSHVTKIEEGKHKGCYLLGIDSLHIIESCKPNKD
jgi:hypothetical protein